MKATTLNRKVQAELRGLAAQGVLTESQAALLAERYPTEPWDLLILLRWAAVLGAVTAAAGAVLLAQQLEHAIRLLEATLGAAALGLGTLGAWLRWRRQLARSGAALELLGALALHGLVVTVAIDLSTGSDDWPALVGLCAASMLACAYGLRNSLILIVACCDLFTWFGGATGYASGFGAYWLDLNYPARFIAAGLASIGVAWLHAAVLPRLTQAFSRVYLHFGLLVINLALWSLALFGYFETEVGFSDNAGARIGFSALWGAISIGSVLLGSRLGQRALRGYGLTFLAIDLYTFYFQFVVMKSTGLWWVHLLFTGGSLVVLGAAVERSRQMRPPAPSAGAT